MFLFLSHIQIKRLLLVAGFFLLTHIEAVQATPGPLRVGLVLSPGLAELDSRGAPDGFFVKLLEEIAVKEGWKLEFVLGDVSLLLPRLREHKIDLLAPMAYSEERAEQFIFPEQSILLDWGVVVCSSAHQIERVHDLQNAEIAVVKDSLFAIELKHHLTAFHVEARLKELNSPQDVASAVAAGQVIAGAFSNLSAQSFEKSFPIVRTPIIYSPTHISIATARDGRPDVIAKIDARLATLKANPSSLYYTLQEHWFPHQHTHPAKYIFAGMLLLAAFSFASWKALSFRRQVRQKIAEQAALNQQLLAGREELFQLNQQFQSLLDGIPDHLMLIASDMRIVWMNRAARAACSQDPSGQGGVICHQVWTKRATPCENCPALACFRTGQGQEVTLANGERTFGVKAFPIYGGEGSVEYVIKLAIDITEKMRQREAHDHENRLSALGTLSAGMAHEINNPVGLILSNLEIVSEAFSDIAPYLDERFQDHGDYDLGGLPFSRMRTQLPALLKETRDATQRIRQTVSDLKDFARGGAAREASCFPLAVAIERALRIADHLLRKATDNFQLDLASEPIILTGNQLRVEQVLINLLANACQALPDRSRAITLMTRYDPSRSAVAISVCDEGVGIPDEHLPKLATPFFTTRQADGGTGLGLSVSFGIIREHGGHIEFTSRPGSGTSVTVTLPAATVEPIL